MKQPPPRTFPTFARELLRARERLGLAESVGLALREERRALGMSQRSYAGQRGWSQTHLARLESAAGRLRLDDVVAALESTPFVMTLCRRPGDGSTPPAGTAGGGALPVPVAVPPDAWPRPELIARVRGGSRRFPGHRRARQVDYPPLWWWNNEATWAVAEPPYWYAPVTADAWSEPDSVEDTPIEGRPEAAGHEAPGTAAA